MPLFLPSCCCVWLGSGHWLCLDIVWSLMKKVRIRDICIHEPAGWWWVWRCVTLWQCVTHCFWPWHHMTSWTCYDSLSLWPGLWIFVLMDWDNTQTQTQRLSSDWCWNYDFSNICKYFNDNNCTRGRREKHFIWIQIKKCSKKHHRQARLTDSKVHESHLKKI